MHAFYEGYFIIFKGEKCSNRKVEHFSPEDVKFYTLKWESLISYAQKKLNSICKFVFKKSTETVSQGKREICNEGI